MKEYNPETFHLDQGPLILEFYAAWCGTCRGVHRSLTKLKDKSDIPVYPIDIEEFADFTKEFNIQGVPVMILIKDGVEIARRAGSTTYEELVSWLWGAGMFPE
jgi:thioredoxin-like negative regulator of GroEL